MFEKLFSSALAYRQSQALEYSKKAVKDLFKGKSIFAVFLILIQTLGLLLFDFPTSPAGEEIDLSGYELVFEDEFEGDTLDLEKWAHRGQGKPSNREGYFADSQVRVEDGNMIIRGEYLEDGKFGPGWYAGMVKVAEDYKFGYFEIKCIVNSDNQFWSAFWLQSNHSYNPEISKGGVGGAEIDIFEAFNYGKNIFMRDGIRQTIWCSGMENDPSDGQELNKLIVGYHKGKNIYTEYNTYGLEWNEDEYIFYINGVETARTSFADGTSKVPEQVIVSLCLPEVSTHEKDFSTEFIVDYVRIYQK